MNRTQREIGEEAGFRNAEGLFLSFIQETCSPQLLAEAIVQFGLQPESLLDVDPKLFALAEKRKEAKNKPKPPYIIAPKKPYPDKRAGYLLGLTDAIMIHFHNSDCQAMKSLIDWSGVIRRELVHAGADPEDIDDIDDVLADQPDVPYWGQA